MLVKSCLDKRMQNLNHSTNHLPMHGLNPLVQVIVCFHLNILLFSLDGDREDIRIGADVTAGGLGL